jgi:hypothetical protein
MKAKGPKSAARPGGGFRQGFGHFNEEHLEQDASGAAAQQKQLAQQTTQTSQQNTGGSAQQQGNSNQSPAQQLKSEPPREISGITDELVKRPARDIVKGLESLFDIHELLDINSGDTPEEQSRKKQLNQRFQQLTNEQQEVAKKRYQQEIEKKKLAEEEQEEKKMAKQEKKQAGITPPASPKKGPVGMAGMSKKQKASTQLEQQRQSIGRVAGTN